LTKIVAAHVQSLAFCCYIFII